MSRPAGQLKGRAARLVRLMPAGPSNAARTPFVLLVVVLLGGGLITLLVLNSALNEGSFRLSELKKRTTELTDEQQALQRDVDNFSKPDALERRARELGMVPGGSPAFLNPDGTVRGVPAETTAEPVPPPQPKSSAPAAPPASPAAGPRPGAPAPPAPSPSATPSGAAAHGTSAPRTSAIPPAGTRTPAEQTPTSPGR
ncbi:septum formation initiator family protein [Streptomyces sp. NBC_00257]|uniref:FtsB family cell division protein n=1 Tax=unclassified Streptomyces TaxID=2593676 RepID=UPI002255FB67|nr:MULTISPECIES: septum formation initiator [unclassified Streptomyces]WTB53802.1 septum formation initiator family protein [Streptomyces sp. NBC_00826]WTH93310.1 septum formation initiator family protein [Streptomyces sp. NBC_00825]WTI02042.1 septum formation initiator family protein [Streptomyces sp. NBC_00822]MCX4867648.1 septum formation initiator family protein [Streptomyces sp. NBC_00906]MCX4898886.1 septum formation initiator family protein [Streptomyces sp. NBC_00892]